MLDRLFVYGTLMRGFDNPMARLLSEGAECLGAATILGRLYRIRHYPGLVEPRNPADVVYGEVFRMRQPRELLLRLDDYESCTEAYPEPREYRREIADVTLHSGAAVSAYVYIYNWDVAGLPHIASGRFQPDSAG
ncbi:MAG: gamma-glutamylcyclotransferase [Rhodopseudomonas palustris]|uniref:Gamma-glutamylcyclotransferase n=1 Tax=Rhodopseudomonas palustris TaxID=1076 RepID=A0A933RUM6_RHOPL|nr:gamma-glutamylcyclotransferase [Rhodopseudomonas palustris]